MKAHGNAISGGTRDACYSCVCKYDRANALHLLRPLAARGNMSCQFWPEFKVLGLAWLLALAVNFNSIANCSRLRQMQLPSNQTPAYCSHTNHIQSISTATAAHSSCPVPLHLSLSLVLFALPSCVCVCVARS